MVVDLANSEDGTITGKDFAWASRLFGCVFVATFGEVVTPSLAGVIFYLHY